MRGESAGVAQQEQLMNMLKALADESRLLLLRLLSEREYMVSELAEQIKLTEPTVSHHLARLREAGLVTLRMDGNKRLYCINVSGVAKFKRLSAELEKMPPAAPAKVPDDDSWIAALGWSEEDQQILREHTAHGEIVRLPQRRQRQKKLLVILRWLATLFAADRLYTELEVNSILKAVYPHDHVSLRRDLVDFGYLRRERGGGKYWLAPAEEQIATETDDLPNDD